MSLGNISTALAEAGHLNDRGRPFNQRGTKVMVETEVQPVSQVAVGNWFRKRCNEAGLPHCSAHGLRKAGASIAAENVATENQLMAIFGWETTKEAARYTKTARQKKMARDVMPKLLRTKNGT